MKIILLSHSSCYATFVSFFWRSWLLLIVHASTRIPKWKEKTSTEGKAADMFEKASSPLNLKELHSYFERHFSSLVRISSIAIRTDTYKSSRRIWSLSKFSLLSLQSWHSFSFYRIFAELPIDFTSNRFLTWLERGQRTTDAIGHLERWEGSQIQFDVATATNSDNVSCLTVFLQNLIKAFPCNTQQ